MSSRKTVGASGGFGSAPAAPMTVICMPSLMGPAFDQSSSLRMPLSMTFMRSTGTPVAAYTACLKSVGGASVLSGSG
jgi:hypothetical protein